MRPDLLSVLGVTSVDQVRSMSVYKHVHHTLYAVCRRQPFTSDNIYYLCRHIHMYSMVTKVLQLVKKSLY